MNQLSFDPLYLGDRLNVVNPSGDVGVVTLWTRFAAAQRKLTEISPSLLDPRSSRIAVVANLYGDGMYAMFCNLLHNPQVRHVIAIGEDLGLPTTDEIQAFLDRGLEETELLGKPVSRVVGTNRVFPFDTGFPADRLRQQITFRAFGKFSRPDLGPELMQYLDQLPSAPPPTEVDRVQVEIPAFDASQYAYRPSAMNGHEVSRPRALHCWQELVTRVIRFGRPVKMGKGSRLELLNVRAVITEPEMEAADSLAEFGFNLGWFAEYQDKMLEPALPVGITYTYGNRLRGYEGDGRKPYDALDKAATLLANNHETRQAYISLWDSKEDLATGSPPCLTTVFFRVADGRLNLSATYRAHNLLIAWMQNVYGLMAIQRYVAEKAGLPIGPITVVSHSLGIDPDSSRYDLGKAIAEYWDTDEEIDPASGRHILRADPNGYFVVTVDDVERVIVAEHRFDGLLIKRYSSDRAAKIEREIIGDMAVSLVSHAMWVGRELQRAEETLRARRKTPAS